MTEQELVKWYKACIDENFQAMLHVYETAETLEELEKFQKLMSRCAKELKTVAKMLAYYLAVEAAIKNDTDKE